MNTPPVSTPSQQAATHARDAGSATRTPPRPNRAEQDGFDGALRRAGERPASADDEASLRDEDQQDGAHENLLAAVVSAVPRAMARPPIVAGLTAAPLSATGNAMAMQIAQPALSASALSPHALGASPQAWAVQLGDSGLPVQQLTMQRGATGLHLALGTSADTRRLPLDRLRERLVGKGQALQSLRQHPLSDDPSQGPVDP
jgi:hypothetical protein